MAYETISLLMVRKRYLPCARILLATSALATGLTLSPRGAPWALTAAAAFLAIGLFTLRGTAKHQWAFGLLVLLADLAFFAVLVSSGIGARIGLPAIYYFCLVAETATLHHPPEVLIVVAVSAIVCVAEPSDTAAGLRTTTLVAGILAYGFSVYKKMLEGRMQDLKRIATETQEEARRAREAERHRIASDFHDGPLQSFISLQMRIEILRKLLERDSLAGMQDFPELQNLAQQQVKELRAFVRSMRPMDMDGANLLASARRLCENFQKESGIPVTFVGSDGALKLPEETASEVIQMVGEALHNVLKHAGATRVAVSVERAAKTLEISLDDNGQGFLFSGVYSLDELELLRLGPASLKRRARALNSEMTLESRPGRGAGIKLRIPIA